MSEASSVSGWMIAAAVQLLALVPCGIVCLRGDAVDRLIGLEMAGVVEVIFFMILAEAMRRPAFFDLALTLAFLAFGAGLVFARFIERWL